MPNGCWRYLGTCSPNGYIPIASIKGKTKNVAGLFLTHIKGIEQPWGTQVCHKCSTKACVNPDHVRFDTAMANAIDTVKDGNHNSQKLSLADVRRIRVLLQKGFEQKKIAGMFSVSTYTISNIKLGKTWAWAK